MKKILLAGLGLAALLSGCGGPSENERLLFGLSEVPESLDPIAVQDEETALVTAQIFEGLVRFAPNEGIPEEVGAIDCLAVERDISPDQRTYHFVLRDEVRFHDGTALDAEAVCFSFERLLGSPRPTGTPEESAMNAFLEVIESVQALDPKTVRFQLKEPYSSFMKDLGRPYCAIVSPAAVEKHGEEFGAHPVGTGPFRFVESSAKKRIVLERWGSHWREKRAFPGVEFLAAGEQSDRLEALRRGEIHLSNVSDLKAVQPARKDGGLSIDKTAGVSVVALAMDCSKEPFGVLGVRQAVATAINKKALVDRLLEGSAQAAEGVLPPSIWGYRERPPLLAYNPEKSTELLIAAGYPDGFECKFTVPTSASRLLPRPEEIAQALQKDLEAVGIRTEIEYVEDKTMREAIRDRKTELSLRALTSPSGDADPLLGVFAGEAAAGFGFQSPPISHLLDLARKTTEGDKRQAYYAQLDMMIVQDVPWVFLYHPYRMTAVSDDVAQYYPHPTGLHHLWDVTLR